MNRTEGMETVEAGRIKFTSAFVQEVGERVKRLTDGTFALGTTGTHPEHGTSYTDSREDIAWYGPQGARQACAYYTAAAMAWLRERGIQPETADGEFLLAVQVAYSRYGGTAQDRESYDQWEARGSERGQRLAGE